MTNKIFVYDVSKGFSRFFIKNFSSQYEIVNCFTSYDLSNFDLSKFEVAFFVVSDNDDLINFTFLKNNIKLLFIVSSSKQYNDIFSLIEDLIVIDFSNSKNEIIEKINYNLKLIF